MPAMAEPRAPDPTVTSYVDEREPSLLVITSRGTSRHVLADRKSFILGRAEDADVRVEDSSVSRRHARLDLEGGAVLHDLGSHNGTRLNGAVVEGSHPVATGDVIGLGEATVIAYLGRRPRWRSEVLAGDILARLEAEADRATRFERPLAVVAVDLGGASPDAVASLLRGALRPCDAVGPADGLLLAVLPELRGEAADAAARRLVAEMAAVAPRARAGLAVSPADGIDAATLLAAARDGIGGDVHGGRRLEVGDRVALVADPAMLRLFDLLRRLAASDLPVLLSGETGVGKEIAAHAVHAWSPRAGGPFVPVNCGALPENLVESELFGYKKGAFSGADKDKVGYFQSAAGGTLFLDEIGELPPAAQAKLLRALDTRQVARVGDVATVTVDVRVVAASNRDLEAEVAAGRFRQDLFYRLSGACVILPPLRDRPRDIPVLARAFLARAAERLGRPGLRLSDAALRLLLRHRFAGNLRELVNAMDYAAAIVPDDVVETWHLPPAMRGGGEPVASGPPATTRAFRPIAEEIEELEKRRMSEALKASGGNQSRAADLIGMPRRTFVTKMGKYDLRGSGD
jgi:DNA-binding NtrC family response regulator